MSTLKDNGFRFVLRGEDFKWVHPAEMKPEDIDCTDMDDAEFEALVTERSGTPFSISKAEQALKTATSQVIEAASHHGRLLSGA